MPERTLMATLARLEVLNAAASICMVVALVAACLLLDRQYRRLGVMEQELVLRNQQGSQALTELRERNEQGQRGLNLADERNRQGQRQLELLEEAVRRLETDAEPKP